MNYEMMKLTFGEKFKLLRQMAGRSEAETAALLKKPFGTYSRLEEDFLYPTESMLRKVAKLYGITYKELMEIGENNSETVLP